MLRDWHETKVLAENGFSGAGRESLESRCEATEKALFARIGGMGRDIENKVLNDGSGRLRSEGQKAETRSAVAFGSADHREAFATSLKGTAEAQHVNGRVLAAADEGKHPRAALATGVKASKTSKRRCSRGNEP